MLDSKINLDEVMNIEGFSWKVQLALLDLICRIKNPKNVLEIGTWHGRSGVIFSSYVNDNKGTYWGIEPDPTRAGITETNCKKYCPDGQVVVERNISDYSDLKKNNIPWMDIVHIDGEHSYTAVFNDLNLARKLLFNDGVIILDDFYFDMYPQITQATYKWLDMNPDCVLFAAGVCKGLICSKKHYKFWSDTLLSEDFVTTLKQCNNGYSNKITITRTSPLMDCPTFGISTNISSNNFLGNEAGDGSLEHVC